MIPTRHLPIFVALFLLVFSACQKNSDAEPDIIVTTPPEFTLDIFEQREDVGGKSVLGFWIESLQSYPCPSVEIMTEVQVNDSEILLSILGVQQPPACTGQNTIAKKFVALGALPVGTYTLQIRLGLNDLIVNKGQLVVSTNRTEIKFSEIQGIDIQQFICTRIPDHYVWGYVAIPNETAEPIADQWLAAFKSQSNPSELAPGFYSYFTVSGTGQVELHKSIAPTSAHEHFIRQINGDLQPLRDLIIQYRNAPDVPLQIQCLSTLGAL
jgi:hypothetical protein